MEQRIDDLLVNHEGDRRALDDLFCATYEELRRLATAVKRGDQQATLTPTALVNEAWLKLAGLAAVRGRVAAALQADRGPGHAAGADRSGAPAERRKRGGGDGIGSRSTKPS